MRRLILTALLTALPLAAQAQASDAGMEVHAAPTSGLLVAETEPVAAAEPAVAMLQILNASEVDLDSLLWVARIVAVVADTPNDPAFIRQMRDVESRAAFLLERDVVVITDSDRRSDSELRRRLRPRGFMLAIIEKDGSITQRRPSPRDVREIAAIIDRFPLRRQEILERSPSGR